MPHQSHVKKLGRASGGRRALLKGLTRSLILHGHIQTTEARAKALRPVAERFISWGCRAARAMDEGDTPENRARAVHCRRMAFAFVQDKAVITKVFEELAQRYKERPGGYTRIMKVGYRVGDAAPISLIELV
ncbi:MAG: 50S ribosomal protein L17 [Chloroflexi bacterium]|nr:50S ribosomal protein L17 [Chloroflexota bacterium]